MAVVASKPNRRVMLCLEVGTKSSGHKAYVRSDFTVPEETEHKDAFDGIEYAIDLLERLRGVGYTGEDPTGAPMVPRKKKGKKNAIQGKM